MNNDILAFPQSFPDDAGRPWSIENPVQSGMTLRDYFAAKAMQSLIMAGAEIHEHTSEGMLVRPARIAIPPLAYDYADAMLKAREK